MIKGGYIEVTVAPCGDAPCGRITGILKRKLGEPLNDAHDDDPALRDRPVEGITILKDLRWNDGAWHWRSLHPGMAAPTARS